ncbi:MAG: hypothetical protein C4294_01930, partial [Nitrospiraceae bacterium]
MSIAYHAPELYAELLSYAAASPDQQEQFERQVLGVERRLFAVTLLRLWNLPPELIEIIRDEAPGSLSDLRSTRWITPIEQFHGLVRTTNLLASVIFGPPSPAADKQRTQLEVILQKGTALPTERFYDILVHATIKGRELLRAIGYGNHEIL